MSFLSFKINKEFVEGYANRKVPWGFVDANGTSVSEITYLRTYSRIKEDGSKERWHETCERVINGTFSLQKDWAKKNRLPWNDNKAQKAAQEAYHNLWSFKWSPPGRGLWAMGTERVHGERGSSTALNNCLRGDTGVITSTGVKKIKDLAGTKPTLLTENGKWIQAPVASFGNQRLMKITLQRAKSDSKVIYATPDHRWFTRHAKRSSGQWTETLTKDLTDKHQLKSVYGQGVKGRSMVPSPFGVAHGFVFGDGRRAPGDRNSNSVTLFGDKDKSLFKYFELCLSRENNTCDVPGIEFSQIPNYFFDKPSLSETKTYLLGWLSGYFAADGYVSSDGANVSLTSYNRENLEYVRNVCSVLGIGVFQIREGRRVSNLTGRKHTYYSVSFMRDTLSEEFFVLDKHRERFSSNGHGSRRYNWRIVSVEETDLVEEVFCATVDGTHSFVLEDNILTGNCSVWSTRYMTKDDPSYPFVKLANNSFLGVGVGFDTEGAKKGFVVQEPVREGVYEVPDTREGWADSVGVVINAYLKTGAKLPEFDYSQIRPEGSPIKTFGGIAPGPGPLIKMHKDLCEILSNRIGEELSTVDIVDIANIIGVGVVSGGVRRSALLAAGDIDDQAFIESKDYEKYPYRSGFGWMSNNSVKANVGDDLTHILDGIKLNGEPGILWLDVAHNYGRIEDGYRTDDQKTVATNPCGEIFLEGQGELCCLADVYIGRQDSKEEFFRSLKNAYLYAKTVTLLPTEDPDTNSVIQRNRRIGVSLSGTADFADVHGLPKLREWMDDGYKYLKSLDEKYSKWLCVRESIRLTTIKPGGTTGIVAAQSPGVHWTPGGKYFKRGIVFQKNDPIVEQLRQAGYEVEDSYYTPETSVFVQFPIKSEAKRSEGEVTLFEKANLAATAQRYWADNSVSVTLSFDAKEESDQLPTVLQMYEGQLKSASFLPQGSDIYPQQPYQKMTEEEYERVEGMAFPVDLDPVYRGNAIDGEGEAYCQSDKCEIPKA